MLNDLQLLLQTNPVVEYSLHGMRRSHWFNYTVLVDASVKKLKVDVYANTPNEARLYAERLAGYVRSTPVSNHGNTPYDISVGVTAPKFYPIEQAYYASLMIDMAVNLRIGKY